MGQPKIKLNGLREYRKRKKALAEQMRSPHPFITAALDRDGKLVALGIDRERLSQYLASKGLAWNEMVDQGVVL